MDMDLDQKIIEISGEESVQGSGAWLRFRQGKIGASDSPIIMGVSPWSTPYQLWRDKKGLNFNKNAQKGRSLNFMVERGNRWEPIARARYEIHNNIPMEPAVVTHVEFDWLIASLDGYNKEAKRVLEIKIPGAEVFEAAKSGVVHEKYVYQLEHQLLVSQAQEAHFFCCKVESKNGKEQITDDALVIYHSDPERRELLIPKLHYFWGYMQRNEPPPLTDKDVLITEDIAAKSLFEQIGLKQIELGELEKKISTLESEQHALKKRAARFLTHPKVRAGWVELRQNKRFPTNWDVKILGE